MRRCWPGLLVVVVCVLSSAALAAPEMTSSQRQLLEATTDRDDQLDRPGLYELLDNALSWDADDFSGDRGAATPPTPDYAYLAEHPGPVRGEVFLIEGVFVEQVRFPSAQRDRGDYLQRIDDDRWGRQLTGWGIQVGEGEDDVVMVYFIDPEAKIEPPKQGQRVRVAARFYKVWSVPNREGRDLDFLTFVGGGREVLTGGPKGGGGASWNKMIIVGLVLVAGAYYGMRVFLTRKANAGRAHSQAMLDQRHRERGYALEDDEEEVDSDLPEDPADALAYLRAKEKDNVQ